MSKLAKALYDNTAECPEELAFRKGDILTVVEQHVSDTSGWWMCSVHGRQGLAPANRLQLLQQTLNPGEPNIYQIPSRLSGHVEEQMDNIYEVPSTPSSSSSTHIPQTIAFKPKACDENKPSLFNTSRVGGEVYDVPNQTKKGSPNAALTMPRNLPKEPPTILVSMLRKRFDTSGSVGCMSPETSSMYAVPPTQHQDPNYDIPVPSATEGQENKSERYSTLPIPCKKEWIYDVPTSPDKHNPPQRSTDVVPNINRKPSLKWSDRRGNASLYDIPKPSSTESQSPPKVLPRVPVCIHPSAQRESVDIPKGEVLPQFSRDHLSDHIPLECRRDSVNTHDFARVHMHRVKNILGCTSFQTPENSQMSSTNEKEKQAGAGPSSSSSSGKSQRISMASNSSSSSCDSLQMSLSSQEPQPEVTLSQEEACRVLLELQQSVSGAVPKLMVFVSSRWRCRTHLETHLEEIKQAAEGIAHSLTQFVNFALDIKGNAQRLTDSHLQTRLCKQLCIVEDSSVILKQTVSSLNIAGWPLETLCQDPGEVQTPDQLERFVMVARTVPEDVKRLVSIVNANGKLLFRASAKDPDVENSTSEQETKKSTEQSQLKEEEEEEEDDNDYVELQTKTNFEKHEKEVPREQEKNALTTPKKAECCGDTEEQRAATQSEHCRLYFGALQKALGGFVNSLRDGQPPENFISQSKLVIMVGQRLVDTLCREAQSKGSSQILLFKSNHLCALLKQLAVATKKAALHFPDKQALHEAQEFAKELAQKAQHFRLSLDI